MELLFQLNIYILGHDIKCMFYFGLQSEVGKAEDCCKQRSCSSHGNKKAKDKLTWVATVGCLVLFISLMIDGL